MAQNRGNCGLCVKTKRAHLNLHIGYSTRCECNETTVKDNFLEFFALKPPVFCRALLPALLLRDPTGYKCSGPKMTSSAHGDRGGIERMKRMELPRGFVTTKCRPISCPCLSPHTLSRACVAGDCTGGRCHGNS